MKDLQELSEFLAHPTILWVAVGHFVSQNSDRFLHITSCNESEFDKVRTSSSDIHQLVG